MIKPIPVGEVFDFVLPKDKTNPTIWKLSALGSILKSRILNKTVDIKPNAKDPEKFDVIPKFDEKELGVDVQTTKYGLKGFSNFKLDGKEVEFKTEDAILGGKTYKVVSDETLSYIPREVIAELSEQILKASEISVAEEKN